MVPCAAFALPERREVGIMEKKWSVPGNTLATISFTGTSLCYVGSDTARRGGHNSIVLFRPFPCRRLRRSDWSLRGLSPPVGLVEVVMAGACSGVSEIRVTLTCADTLGGEGGSLLSPEAWPEKPPLVASPATSFFLSSKNQGRGSGGASGSGAARGSFRLPSRRSLS